MADFSLMRIAPGIATISECRVLINSCNDDGLAWLD
jgi:hypothetical protein